MSASSRETVLCRYVYDPLDRQTDCMLLSLPTILRFYCKSRLATEIQGALQTSVFQHDDQLLAQRRHQDGKVDTTLLVTDQQRSVLGARGLTGSHLLAYTPYGHRPAENGLLSLLGFNGERPDPVTGHYHLGNGYRQFNPVLMRFNSPDSWSPFGKGGLNAYAYCDGEPMLGSDPTGHSNIFMSFWKGFKNKFMDRIPKKLRSPTSVATPSAAVSNLVTTAKTNHLKDAPTFNLDALTDAERRFNYRVKPKKNFPPQPEASEKYNTADEFAEKNTKPPTSRTQHEEMLNKEHVKYIESAPLKKLISDNEELLEAMNNAGPSRNVKMSLALRQEIARRMT